MVYRGVAQMVERLTHNQQVGGSNPPPATKKLIQKAMAVLKGVENLIGTRLVPLTIAVADAAALGTYKGQIQGTAQIALQFIVAGADVAPIISIYGSNDLVNWDVYEITSGVTTVTLVTAGSKSVVRDSFPHEYIAIDVNKNGGTTGTISATINVKEQTTR